MCMYFTKTISRNFIMVEGYEGEVLSRFTGERERGREGGRERGGGCGVYENIIERQEYRVRKDFIFFIPSYF